MFGGRKKYKTNKAILLLCIFEKVNDGVYLKFKKI